MKKIDISVPIIISKVKNHSTIKPVLLEYINEIPKNSIVPGEKISDTITHTDWNLPETIERKYLEFIKPIIVDTLSESFKPLKIKGLVYLNFWFQQYHQSDLHVWHIHDNCHWSNVYFVELPNKDMKTEILKIGNEELVDYDVSEGDIISFPSFLYHRSPVNTFAERKTIIAFNTAFYNGCHRDYK